MKKYFNFGVMACTGALWFSTPAQAVELQMRNGYDVVGQVQVVEARYEDTFADLGEKHGFGFTEMLLANPKVDPWLPGEGAPVVLPQQFLLPSGPRKGLVINLAEYRMYFFTDKGTVLTYAIGIGTDQSPTPLTETKVRAKVPNPAWYPPESIRKEHAAEGDILPAVVPPGPNNPLGPFKFQLELPSYLIHGSNKRFGIGTRVSHGCIRMYNRDVLALAKMVPVGAPVRFINEPIKLGMNGDDLVIELHAFDTPENEEQIRQIRIDAVKALAAFEREQGPMLIDPKKLEAAVTRVSGLPEVIGQRARMSASGPLLNTP